MYSIQQIISQFPLARERNALDRQLASATLGTEQRMNVARINEMTDGVAKQISDNPAANAVYESIRERTLNTMYAMAGLNDGARTREEVIKLLEAGVDFFIGQLENQLRQVLSLLSVLKLWHV